MLLQLANVYTDFTSIALLDEDKDKSGNLYRQANTNVYLDVKNNEKHKRIYDLLVSKIATMSNTSIDTVKKQNFKTVNNDLSELNGMIKFKIRRKFFEKKLNGYTFYNPSFIKGDKIPDVTYPIFNKKKNKEESITYTGNGVLQILSKTTDGKWIDYTGKRTHYEPFGECKHGVCLAHIEIILEQYKEGVKPALTLSKYACISALDYKHNSFSENEMVESDIVLDETEGDLFNVITMAGIGGEQLPEDLDFEDEIEF